jgi:radical SAM protein with 4Fe4S-binding SPASM domain
MKQIIVYGLKKYRENGLDLKFSATTNGSLLDEDRLTYCHNNDVDIYLSIDGNKSAHEEGRGIDTFDKIEELFSLYRMYPEIPLNIQMVVTPDTAKHLLDSVQFLVSAGVSKLNMNFCYDQAWSKDDLQILRDQYHKAYNYLVQYNKNGGEIRFKQKKKRDPLKPLFRCDAGQDLFAITPDGYIYGCSMHIPISKRAYEQNMYHLFSDLCLGHIDDIGENEFEHRLEALWTDKRFLGQYHFHTSKLECRDCDYVCQCDLCPVYAMIFSKDQFFVPDWMCEIKRIEQQTN